MKKKYVLTIILFLISTVFVITFIQIKWIKDSIKTQERQFIALVNKILDDIIKEYEIKEIIFSKKQEIISASPDSTLALDFENNAQIQKLLRENKTKKNIIIYRETQDKIKINNNEFVNQINNQNTLFIAQLNKTLTAKKINLNNRINPKEFKEKIDSAFKANNIKFNYQLAIIDQDQNVIFKTKEFKFSHSKRETFSKILFPHTHFNLNKYLLLLYFETNDKNLFNYLPSLAISTIIFTIILLIVLSITIYLILRQKRISELKTDFVNNVSHELKTPIATIQLATEMLTDKSLPKNPQRIQEVANIIKRENERMRYNIEKILQTSVIEKGVMRFKFQHHKLHTLLEKIINNFQVQLKQKNVLIIKNFYAKDDTIILDETHFTNAIINLLENAAKYNNDDPVIEIETSNEKNKLVISITDNGIGIPKAEQKKIFEKFYRAHDGDVHNYKSFGLGLNYVKKIIEEHQGKITVESEPGKGSTFTIYLPLAKYFKKKLKLKKNG